jgi:hypothetical protein
MGIRIVIAQERLSRLCSTFNVFFQKFQNHHIEINKMKCAPVVFSIMIFYAVVSGCSRDNPVVDDRSKHVFYNLHDAVKDPLAVYELHLGSDSLDSFPHEITSMTNLEDLILQNNRLSQLPADFSNLTKLTFLDLIVNRFTEFPRSITSLKKLQVLLLWSNSISKIPADIRNLEALTMLDLGSNNIDSLPTELFDLPQLHELRLQGNRISAFPVAINPKCALQDLYLGDNTIPANEQWRIANVLLPNTKIHF